MRNVFVLEEQTIGKIAAGEVVDRPASVVKELIENSIDAGSRHLVVEVGEGGRDYIRVTDDGCGISEDDVAVAFEKHATSKIKSIEDLASLHTLGFRGEALPSIAAVSRVEMSTRHESEDFGNYLSVEAGEIKERRRITRVVGTTIEVKSLFYNLPARIGTIKSKSTELRHIMDVFINYAVINQGIKFELFHDDKLIVGTSGNGKMLDAIVNAFGSFVAKELIELKGHDSAVSTPLFEINVGGYISKPAASYSTKKHIFTFVNGRFVKSELINKAIKRGYMSLLPKHAYPFSVVSLYIEPAEINVNIHPKKHEISFYHADDVFRFIVSSVSTTLGHADLIPEVVQREKSAERRGAAGVDLFVHAGEKKVPVSVQAAIDADMSEDDYREQQGGGSLDLLPAPLYQVLDSYIIAQSEVDDVIMIDQHAAAERINFEKLIKKYGRRIDKQTLLRAYVPELSPRQLYLLRESEQALRAMGFDIERLGDDGYIIRAIPVVFYRTVGEDEIMMVIEDLVEECGKRDDKIRVLFGTAACKASIKAGEKLSYEGMREIVDGLRNAEIPYTCPHGRPTMIRLSKIEIEKRFKRR